MNLSLSIFRYSFNYNIIIIILSILFCLTYNNSGMGYPWNVLIISNVELDIGAIPAPAEVRGNFEVEEGATARMDVPEHLMTQPLRILGDFTNYAIVTTSPQEDGDILVEGKIAVLVRISTLYII